MTIIDWNDKKSMEDAGGVIKETSNPLFDEPEIYLYANNGMLEGILFRNFPKIKAKEKHLKKCVFENCGYLSFDDCEIHMGEFFGSDTVDLTASTVTGAVFDHICSCYGEPILLDDSELTGCVFANITLLEKSRLCVGYGDCHVELCSFHKISTDREDKDLFTYEPSRKRIFGKKKNIEYVDADSCSGLDEITVLKESCKAQQKELSRLLCSGPCLLPGIPRNLKSPCVKKRK